MRFVRRCHQNLVAMLTIGLFAFITVFAFTPRAYAEPKALDDAGLKQMLVNMGTSQRRKNLPTALDFAITGQAPDLNWTVGLSVSGPTGLVWIGMDFWLKDKKIPNDVLLEALERNEHLDTVRFMYLKDAENSACGGSIPNRDITPVELRKLIDETNEARQTQHLWNPNTGARNRKEEAEKEPDKAAPKRVHKVAAPKEPEKRRHQKRSPRRKSHRRTDEHVALARKSRRVK